MNIMNEQEANNSTAEKTPRVVYRIKEAAARLGVSEKSIRRAIQRGKLKANHTFRVWLIPAAELERFINSFEGA